MRSGQRLHSYLTAPTWSCGQQVNVRHQQPWGDFSFLPQSVLEKDCQEGPSIIRKSVMGVGERSFHYVLLNQCVKSELQSYLIPKLHRQFFLMCLNLSLLFEVPAWCFYTAVPAQGTVLLTILSCCPWEGQDWGLQNHLDPLTTNKA